MDGVRRLEHRDQLLAGHATTGPVGRVDLDPCDVQPLVRQRQRDPLDVRRKRDAMDAQAHARAQP